MEIVKEFTNCHSRRNASRLDDMISIDDTLNCLLHAYMILNMYRDSYKL